MSPAPTHPTIKVRQIMTGYCWTWMEVHKGRAMTDKRRTSEESCRGIKIIL